MKSWNQKELEQQELGQLRSKRVQFPKQSDAVFQDGEEIDELDFKFKQKRRQQIIKDAVMDSIQQKLQQSQSSVEEPISVAESSEILPKSEKQIPPDKKNAYFTKVQQVRQSALAIVAQKLQPRRVEVDESKLEQLRTEYEKKIDEYKKQLDDAADQQQFAVNNIRQQYKNKIEGTR